MTTVYYLGIVLMLAWGVSFFQRMRQAFVEKEFHGAAIGMFIIIMYLSFLGVMYMFTFFQLLFK